MTTENKKGYFGEFGGSYVPEVVQKALDKLEEAYNKYKDDEEFLKEYHHYLKDYSGRETPLYFAESLTNYLGGAKIYLKREDLNHLGAHKLNNVIGQILLAKRMGKKKVIAETGAGQHGVAIGAFAEFIPDKEIKLVGVEAAGKGLNTDRHAATLTLGTVGVLDGMKTYALFNEDGSVKPVYSISPGLDYPGIGPEHAFLRDSNRAEYVSATDDEAVNALLLLTKKEGIIPAIESSHALAEVIKRAPKLGKDKIIIVNVSGRGDKDVAAIAEYLKNK